MLQMVLSAIGVMMLLGGVPGLWLAREALRNTGPHSLAFLWGGGLAVLAYGLFATALIFNSATWFGATLGSAVALYIAGTTLQRIGRRRG